MNKNEHLMNFIRGLMNTNSPAQKLNHLYEFIRKEPELFTKQEQDELIATFTEAKITKSKQGLNDVSKRWKKTLDKFSDEEDTRWAFIPSSRYGTRCAHCNERYEIGEAVFLKNPGNKGFHIECTPKEVKDTNDMYKDYLHNHEGTN